MFWKPAEKNCQKAEKFLLGAQVREENQKTLQETGYKSMSSSGNVECSFDDLFENFPKNMIKELFYITFLPRDDLPDT